MESPQSWCSCYIMPDFPYPAPALRRQPFVIPQTLRVMANVPAPPASDGRILGDTGRVNFDVLVERSKNIPMMALVHIPYIESGRCLCGLTSNKSQRNGRKVSASSTRSFHLWANGLALTRLNTQPLRECPCWPSGRCAIRSGRGLVRVQRWGANCYVSLPW